MTSASSSATRLASDDAPPILRRGRPLGGSVSISPATYLMPVSTRRACATACVRSERTRQASPTVRDSQPLPAQAAIPTTAGGGQS